MRKNESPGAVLSQTARDVTLQVQQWFQTKIMDYTREHKFHTGDVSLSGIREDADIFMSNFCIQSCPGKHTYAYQ